MSYLLMHPDTCAALKQATTEPPKTYGIVPGIMGSLCAGITVTTHKEMPLNIAEHYPTGFTLLKRMAELDAAAAEKAGRFTAYNNAQPGNFALKFIYWIGAKLRAFFCSVKKLWSVAKVR